ncbi:MAG: hypothetical protein EOO24_63210 [Comamonadaceae bacterium]|nr:MAG: hypothetical protein EOO24_63210 [Comamonadaceae bacterium]
MTTPVHRFRMAMAKHLGKVMTPEVAAAIEAEAFAEPEQAIDPDRFDPVRHGDYTIRVESFRSIVDELDPLHREHWLETERHRHGLALNPNYGRIEAMERAGHVAQFTVRRGHAPGGELAGHLRMYQVESLHTQLPVAQEDTLFLRPGHRPGGHLMVSLLRHAERVHTALGASEIQANSKVINGADVLMRRLRYQHVGNQFSKILKEKSHVL